MNTKIMSAVIVDDEPGAIQALEAGLKAYDDILVVDTQTNEQKARRSILRNKPDILFMDVEMPGISGIDLIKEMRPLMGDNTHVVFYTAYDKYLIDALRASAFDYLLKPYTPKSCRLSSTACVKTAATAGRQPLRRHPLPAPTTGSRCRPWTVLCCCAVRKYSISIMTTAAAGSSRSPIWSSTGCAVPPRRRTFSP